MTSFPHFLDKRAIPGSCYVEDPVVVDGQVVTARGPGTAMDFALELVRLLAGEAVRDRVEAGLMRA
ncbi:MAG: DJ-1/PfpI family protein [Betaproteobacteria bacterium]|nr:DJ-1/PfpI family protein [Betaproteobacteria bacterium]